MKKSFEDVVTEAAESGRYGEWLFLLPASSSLLRLKGAFLVVDVGGGSGLSPMVFVDSGKAVAIDPRAMIYDGDSLEIVWHPRRHLKKVHRVAAKWFAENPDVFSSGTWAGVSPLG